VHIFAQDKTINWNLNIVYALANCSIADCFVNQWAIHRISARVKLPIGKAPAGKIGPGLAESTKGFFAATSLARLSGRP